MDQPDPAMPGGRLYKVCWKEVAASRDSWKPLSSTTVLLKYLRKIGIGLDVKDVLVFGH